MQHLVPSSEKSMKANGTIWEEAFDTFASGPMSLTLARSIQTPNWSQRSILL